MTLNTKALTWTGAILWGGCFFLVGLANLIFPPYGDGWLQLGASIYPGYHGPGGFGSVIVVALYAALDGAICGLLLGWLYNTLAGSKGTA
jgi:hypothetical protein